MEIVKDEVNQGDDIGMKQEANVDKDIKKNADEKSDLIKPDITAKSEKGDETEDNVTDGNTVVKETEDKTKLDDFSPNEKNDIENIELDTKKKEIVAKEAILDIKKEKKTESVSKLSEDVRATLEGKVRNQIEYYFSDISLSRDKFLLDLTAKDDGWVELTTMLKFNRLRQLTEDCDVIVSALKKSAAGLMEVSDDDLKIRRLPSRKLPENTKQRRDEIMSRSVYAKKFPEDSTFDALKTYFTEQHGPVEQVFMRMWGPKDERKFKGSVFVVFEKKEDADKFVKTDEIKYKDEELTRLYKQVYFDKKNAERDEKKRGNKANTNNKAAGEPGNEDEKVKSQMTQGAILHLTGLSDTTKLTHIKTFFMDISPVSWVDISPNKKQAWVRFQSGVAQKSVDTARAVNDGKLVINDAELESTVLEGEAELDYWKKLLKELANIRKQKRKPDGNFGKRKFQRKGEKTRWNKHKKFHDSDEEDAGNNDGDKDDSPPTKAAKLETSE